MTDHIATIDDYIASCSAEAQVILRELRITIRGALPNGEETIAYAIPTFTVGGRSVIHFAAWKHHVSVYPAPVGDAAFETQMARYRSGKGTFKFAYGEPIPMDQIGRLATRLAARASS